MAHGCENCKYSDIGYIFCEELGEEYPIYACEKGNDVSLGFECKDFEEYKPEPYVEQFTECDKCEYLPKCKFDGHVVNATNSMDRREHFIRGLNTYCRKENKPFEYKKLSEVMEIAEKSNDPKLKDGKEFLQKAVDKFGDITFKELMKDKIYEMYEH